MLALSAAGALALDLGTKQWVWDHLRPTGRAVVLWDPLLELAFAYNRGSAFGLVRRLDYPLVLLALTLAMIAWIVLTTRAAHGTRLRFIAGGLIAGGALGNLYDRLFRVDPLGHRGVVDFIKFNYPWGGSWPSFNIADAALVVGVVLLIWDLRARKPAPA
ncbi:signal peptidase II [Nannocystis punicea]|uniref:Lipoprotein signal peptidase n=1 Tax=Nannocystis punicea TaxID=2995304 RepID=A0ABY7GSP6_9BACT|nr:signal peptidase II [Nannocystis poenicansa]WAS89889.1 signal peptidase II [Nannocystis poenicansa]